MILLDTHILIWCADDPSRLASASQAAIAEADRLLIIPISCWEVAMLVRKGRISLDRHVSEWIFKALQLPDLEVTPITIEIATDAGMIDDSFHGDPADRLLVATAKALKCPLVTADARIRDAGLVKTVW